MLSVWYFKSLEKCKHPLGTMFFTPCLYTLHTHTRPCRHSPKLPLFVSSLLRMFRNLSVICGWLELVSNLQKLTILLTTNSPFPECCVGGKTCPALLKWHLQGHKYFYQLHKIWHSSTASKTKNMNNLTEMDHCVLGIHLSLYSPCKIVTETNRFW